MPGQLEPVHCIDYRRDRLGRLVEQYNGDEDYVIFTYQHNRLVSADNGKRPLKLDYDPLGRLIGERQGEHCIRYQYDPQGRRNATQLPDGRQLRYHYDNLKTAITLDDKTLVQSHYNVFGEETQRQFGQLQDQKRYDNAGRLVQHKVSSRQHKHTLVQRQYHYDPRSGLLQQIDDLQRGQTHYHYDAKHQLTRTQGQHPEAFIYDPAGNLLEDGVSINANRLALQGDKHFDYDHHGNRTEERRGKHGRLRTRYTYNGFHQLVKVEKRKADKVTQVVTYEYDAFGRRISKADAFGKTEFLWQGDQLLSERRDHIHKVFLYEWDSFVPLALLQDEKVYYYQNDHLGTPQELLDARGKAVWSVHYNAWGGVVKTHAQGIDNPLRFQGQYYDDETGLHYNRHRYYDPSLGRFMTQDPIGLAGGLNSYRYVPNPVGWVDPLGLQCKNCPAAAQKRHGFVDDVFETDKNGNIVSKGTGQFLKSVSNAPASGNFWDMEVVNLKGTNGKSYEAFKWVGGHPGGQYNCHGTSVGGGQYWINDIMPIVNDFFVPTNQPMVGDLVVWGGGQHSAILSSSGASFNTSLVTGLGGQETVMSTATVSSFVSQFGSPQAYRLR